MAMARAAASSRTGPQNSSSTLEGLSRVAVSESKVQEPLWPWGCASIWLFGFALFIRAFGSQGHATPTAYFFWGGGGGAGKGVLTGHVGRL